VRAASYIIVPFQLIQDQERLAAFIQLQQHYLHASISQCQNWIARLRWSSKFGGQGTSIQASIHGLFLSRVFIRALLSLRSRGNETVEGLAIVANNLHHLSFRKILVVWFWFLQIHIHLVLPIIYLPIYLLVTHDLLAARSSRFNHAPKRSHSPWSVRQCNVGLKFGMSLQIHASEGGSKPCQLKQISVAYNEASGWLYHPPSDIIEPSCTNTLLCESGGSWSWLVYVPWVIIPLT
jgi:hypothetical protein